MRKRWYDPAIQRFLSRDIISSTNRYKYANNGPATYLDFTGRDVDVFYTINGQTHEEKTSTAEGFLKMLDHIPYRSIGYIRVSGHGTDCGCGFDRTDTRVHERFVQSPGYIEGQDPIYQHVRLSSITTPKGNASKEETDIIDKPLVPLLGPRLQPGAKVFLDSCNTANGSNSIAEHLYNELRLLNPTVIVVGWDGEVRYSGIGSDALDDKVQPPDVHKIRFPQIPPR